MAACGILTSALIAAGGINFTAVNLAWSENGGESPSNCSSSIIIPRRVEDQTMRSRDYAEIQPESFESYQIRILRNQNHLQAEKIKTLREEIAEAHRKYHELTPHLFKQGDPADQAKIADLSLKLVEKEKTLDRLVEEKAWIETEMAQSKKKIDEMETIKEALTGMIHKQKALKEQNAQEHKMQLEEMQAWAESEKNGLIKRIHQHETTQTKLNEKIAEKAQTILRLDAIATQQDALLTARENRLNQLNEQILALYDEVLTTGLAYTAFQQSSHEKVQGLTAALDLEQAHSQELHEFKEKMLWISDLYEGSVSFLNDEIETLKKDLAEQQKVNQELQTVKAELNARKLEIVWLLDSQSDYKLEMNSYLQILAEALDEEKNRNNQRAEIMESLLLHLDNAEMALEVQNVIQQEQEELLAAFSLLLDDNRLKVSDLEEKLQISQSAYAQTLDKLGLMEEKLTAYLDTLDRKEFQIETLEKNQIAQNESLLYLSNYYGQRLEAETNRSHQLLHWIEETDRATELAYNDLIHDLYETSQVLQMTDEHLAALKNEKQQMEIENHHLKQQVALQEEWKRQNEEKERFIAKLQNQIEQQQIINSALQNDLSYSRINYAQEQRSRRNLEQLFQEGQIKMAALEKQFSDHAAAVVDKEKAFAYSEIAYEYLLMQLIDLTEAHGSNR